MSVPATPKPYAVETGLIRSARLMRAFGPASSAVWNELDPAEAQRLTRAIEALPPEEYDESEAVAEDVLRAAIIVPKQRRALSDNVWLKLSALEPVAMAGLISNEHPQTIALIFSKLEPSAAAQLAKALPAPLTMDAMRRLLHMNTPHQNAVDAAERTLIDAMADLALTLPAEGHERVARIFDRLDSRSEKQFLAAIENAEPGAGERVRALMFTFEDLANLDSGGLQTLLSSIDRELLTLALKGADPEVEQAFYANITQRAGQILRDEIEALGPVRLSDVEAARSEIVSRARELVQRGDIALAEPDIDEIVE